MKFFIALLLSLVAACSAYPWQWRTSSQNKNKSCIVPVNFKPAPGSMMNVQNTVDAKNGPICNIKFDKVKGMLTVTSNIPSRRVGFLATVSEGTLANNPGTPPQDANKACAFGLGPKTISFKWTPAAAPSLKPIKASASCGNADDINMHTTTNVVIA